MIGKSNDLATLVRAVVAAGAVLGSAAVMPAQAAAPWPLPDVPVSPDEGGWVVPATLSVRVLDRAGAVAGAEVLVEAGPGDLDSEWVTTDAGGLCRWRTTRPGQWTLRARRAGAAAATRPIVVELRGAGEERHVDVLLGETRLLGRLAPAWKRARVCAFALAEADRDPLAHGDLTRSLVEQRVGAVADAEGRFVIDGVPPGVWVLRVVDPRSSGTVWWTRAVDVPPAGSVDLGLVEPEITPAARLAVVDLRPGEPGMPQDLRAFRVHRVEGATRFWVGTVPVEPCTTLPALPPGRYQLETIARCLAHGQWGMPGSPTGETFTVDIDRAGRARIAPRKGTDEPDPGGASPILRIRR